MSSSSRRQLTLRRIAERSHKQSYQPFRFRRILYYFGPFFGPLRLLRIFPNSLRFSAIFYSSNGSTKHNMAQKNLWRRQFLRQISEKFGCILIKYSYILAVWRIEVQIWLNLRSNLAKTMFLDWQRWLRVAGDVRAASV